MSTEFMEDTCSSLSLFTHADTCFAVDWRGDASGPLPINKIIHRDALDGLKALAGDAVNMVVTSPPYFGQRDYGVKEQLGTGRRPHD